MPRPRKDRSKEDKTALVRKCRYCNTNQWAATFKRHVYHCKDIFQIQREDHNRYVQPVHSVPEHGCDAELSRAALEDGMAMEDSMDVDDQVSEGAGAVYEDGVGPLRLEEYIKVVPHPHSLDPTPKIIPITGELASADCTNSSRLHTTNLDRITSSHVSPLTPLRLEPWSPFKTRADFEYTETAVLGRLSQKLVDKQLKGFSQDWAPNGSKLTIKSYSDMRKVLEKAQRYFVQFKKAQITAEFRGKEEIVNFEYRDPWEWILETISDETLAPFAKWNSEKKYYCCRGHEERAIDDFNTGNSWWRVDNELPETDVYPHCYLPLHFWLDKGLATRRVKVYPMILRAGWLPREIRNGSGNGGGVLIGYMPIIEDPLDPKSRSASEAEEYSRFKREVYQKVLGKVFSKLKTKSHTGEAYVCGDKITRIIYPGIPMESQDAEEAAYFCGCRNASANVPCPKCLVAKENQHRITKTYEKRTPSAMRAVLQRASTARTKTEKEAILIANGLHDVQHFLWDFRFSDPYRATSYDTLHSDDLGKWGKHLWKLLLSVLEQDGTLGQLTERMAVFPRWPGLKHFNHVSTTKYTDGQAFFDILKCILPCIVDLLPNRSVLVHCIRAYTKYRMLISLRCMTESRMQHLKDAIVVYQASCENVQKEYGKSFDFLKQHAASHILEDIWDKGTTMNYCTRVGEGFQQEAAESFEQTNMRGAEHQMDQIDERKEAIARIRLAVDNADRIAQEEAAADEDVAATEATSSDTNARASESTPWSFGSPEGKKVNLRALIHQRTAAGKMEYKDLDEQLRTFVRHTLPNEPMRYEDEIYVQEFKYTRIRYQSLEDWTEARDILRCSPLFYGRSRHDTVLIDDLNRFRVAQLLSLLRCWVPSGNSVDLALVRVATPSRWKPKTLWSGCSVLDNGERPTLIHMDSVIRGALLSPVSGNIDERSQFLIDTVDGDMFLRLNEH